MKRSELDKICASINDWLCYALLGKGRTESIWGQLHDDCTCIIVLCFVYTHMCGSFAMMVIIMLALLCRWFRYTKSALSLLTSQAWHISAQAWTARVVMDYYIKRLWRATTPCHIVEFINLAQCYFCLLCFSTKGELRNALLRLTWVGAPLHFIWSQEIHSSQEFDIRTGSMLEEAPSMSISRPALYGLYHSYWM